MPRGKYLSEDLRRKIIEANRSGLRQVEISTVFNLHKSVVSKTISNFKTRNSLKSIKKSGRPRKTTKKIEMVIKKIAQAHPHKSANQVLCELPGVNISSKTVQRRLREAGLFSRRAAKKPFISKKNQKARLNFAKKYLYWSVNDWRKVLFSDESKFNIFGSDGIRWVHRPEGKRFNPKYTRATVKHGGGSCMVWGCFSAYGTGPLHIIEGTMDRFVYLDILKNVMLPFAEDNLPLAWIFQQDNDPKHKSKIIQEWFLSEKVRVMDFPAQSPDLNPIENLWEELDRRVRRSSISNKQDLINVLQESWNSIGDETILKLLESMPKRCREVIANKGYSTHY